LTWSHRRLEPEEVRPAFDCGIPDLNEFFSEDSIVGGRELMSVTYVAEVKGKVVAFYSVSNDAIRRNDSAKSILNKLSRFIPSDKRYKSLPAVKIGRLATCSTMQCRGIGTEILDYIKYSFTHGNKTGCRFIIVDAHNNDRTLNFYKRNGFDFLAKGDEQEATRLMYFDLKRFTA